MSQGEVFTRYRALFGASSVPPFESETVKKVNDLEFVDFLFELIKASKGQKNYKNIVLKGVFSEVKRKADINLQIRKILKSFFACDVNVLIPGAFTVSSVSGVDIDLSEIDPHGLLKMDPNSQVGKHMYDGNNIQKHINYILYNALKTTSDKPMSYSYKDRELFQAYGTSASSIMFKFGDYYKNRPLADWVIDYLDSTEMFNLPNFTAMLMDLLTGAVSLSAGKKKLEIKQDSRVIKALKKIFGFCSEKTGGEDGDINSSLGGFLNDNEITGADGTDDQDFFNFNPKELEEIERDADIRSRGSIRFATCGDLDLEIDPAKVIAGLDLLFGGYAEEPNRNISDMEPGEFDNGEAFFNIDKTNNFFDDMLKDGAKKAIDQGEDGLTLSFPNMQAELQMGIFKAIPYALIKSVLSPKLLLIPKVTSAVIEYQGSKSAAKKVDVKEVIQKITPVLRDIGLQIIDKMISNIFNEIKKDIIKLTKELAIRYIKQRGADYILTLTSILRLLKKLKAKDRSRCTSVLSKLLSLLNLANFGPMPSIPGPLILIGGALKPGMNKVAMVNDLKAKLQQKGIETAPFFPDGTPNYMMYALEEAMGVVAEHIKTRSKIDIFAMGPTGPVKGYGQIQ